MKKLLLLISLLLISSSTFAQKKKKKTPVKKSVEKPIILAKDENTNIEAEYLKNRIYIYYTENNKKDTLFTRKTETAIKPENFKMNVIKVATKDLYFFGWDEAIDKKTELIKENGKINGAEIWDLQSRKNLISNLQKNIDYEEIRYLSKHKDASETISKKINEGKLFTLLANGDVTLSGKQGSEKYSYNATENMYKLVATPKKTTPKKNNTRRR